MAIDIRSLTGNQGPSKPSSAEVRDGGKAQNSPITNQPPEVQPKAAPAAADSVQITHRARDLQGLVNRLSNEPSVDNEKVSRLREDIANGRYTVNSERLAAKILGFERYFRERT